MHNMQDILIIDICKIYKCGAVVKYRTCDREVAGSIPTSTKYRVLKQEALSTLLSTGFYPRIKEGLMED